MDELRRIFISKESPNERKLRDSCQFHDITVKMLMKHHEILHMVRSEQDIDLLYADVIVKSL